MPTVSAVPRELEIEGRTGHARACGRRGGAPAHAGMGRLPAQPRQPGLPGRGDHGRGRRRLILERRASCRTRSRRDTPAPVGRARRARGGRRSADVPGNQPLPGHSRCRGSARRQAFGRLRVASDPQGGAMIMGRWLAALRAREISKTAQTAADKPTTPPRVRFCQFCQHLPEPFPKNRGRVLSVLSAPVPGLLENCGRRRRRQMPVTPPLTGLRAKFPERPKPLLTKLTKTSFGLVL